MDASCRTALLGRSTFMYLSRTCYRRSYPHARKSTIHAPRFVGFRTQRQKKYGPARPWRATSTARHSGQRATPSSSCVMRMLITSRAVTTRPSVSSSCRRRFGRSADHRGLLAVIGELVIVRKRAATIRERDRKRIPRSLTVAACSVFSNVTAGTQPATLPISSAPRQPCHAPRGTASKSPAASGIAPSTPDRAARCATPPSPPPV